VPGNAGGGPLSRGWFVAAGDEDGGLVTEIELVEAVDAAFEITGRGLASWPDPHPDRSPLDEEYSRLIDPYKWRIVGARADAWLAAAADLGLAAVQPHAEVQWAARPLTEISRTDRAMPCAAGALPLVVARSSVGTVDDAGVALGAGAPAICVAWLPDCGCDACDSGSQDVLDELDSYVLSVVSGAFRRLTSGTREITLIRDGRWSASGLPAGPDIDAVLANPSGWNETADSSWLDNA
jgi:hypothetical protein